MDKRLVKETKAAKTMWTRAKALAKDPEFQFQMFVKCLLTASSSAKKGAEWKVRHKRHVLEQAMPGTPSGQCVPTRTSFDTVTTA